MIYKLTGNIDHILPTSVIIDVHGVGYQVEMPLSDLCQLPGVGNEVKIWVYSYVREDAFRLFGFRSLVQRNVFETLISISGVGPKVALAMLSTLDPGSIRNAAFDGRVEVLESVPGIGKRTAERILVELRPKLQRMMSGSMERVAATTTAGFVFEDNENQSQVMEDLRSALENFGYKRKMVDPLIEKLAGEHPGEDFKELMRMALMKLRPATKPEGRL